MTQKTTAAVVRIVVSGRTCRYGQMDNRDEARAMLSDALASSQWPAGVASFAVTPGGFVRARLPRDYAGRRGWNTRKSDLHSLFPYAEEAVRAVTCGHVLNLASDRARFLTLGVDLNVERHKEERIREDHSCLPACPRACTHAELVAVFDTASARVIRWTGKSYPTNAQQHTLVHQKDLRSHFLVTGSERVLVLVVTICIYSVIEAGRPWAIPRTRKSAADTCMHWPGSSSRR